ncbi:MAG: diaminopimelate decarboxylase [Bacteroidales bacterium]
MFNSSVISKLQKQQTPFYYYDLDILHQTLTDMKRESGRYGFNVHYAVKANFNPRIMQTIAGYGFGADCVSGNEIKHALENGFKSPDIVFAGVGKTDPEIEFALKSDIFCFNCESKAEISVIGGIAKGLDRVAPIALRINPDVDANTHSYITTGVEDTKFGIRMADLEEVVELISAEPFLKLKGIHFHIGSQIIDLTVFERLCHRVNELQDWLESRGIEFDIINVGGGLGIDHHNPATIPQFAGYFAVFGKHLRRKDHQQVFFEIGRAAVGQAASLITRVLYLKDSGAVNYIIVDAGMTDLLRPALYQAYHHIENLNSDAALEKYSVAGPVCESADIFARMIELPATKRGDLLAIRSAGAYGEAMASRYNMRDLPGSLFSDDI